MKASFHTLGCKLNFAETSSFMKQFRENGFSVTDNIRDRADVCVINTCTVTEKADRECRQIIRRALRSSPDAYIIVVGCYAQLAPEEIASIDGVDLVLGSSEKFSILKYADQSFRKERIPKVHTSSLDESTGFGPAFSYDGNGRTRSFLKIQDGCDFNCSFCTIPLARGSSRSQPVAQTVDQARMLVGEGFKEIVLTGVNVGDYGKKEGASLMMLLGELDKIGGLRRIRISSIEPNLLDDSLLDYWQTSDKLVPHFHIPLQSGDDAILRRMRRRYTTAYYSSLIDKISVRFPQAGIGVDVIVGFPGETEAHFDNTYRFLADLRISYLHVFTYSERENTPAASFDLTVDKGERTRRTRMLRILSTKKRRSFMEKFLGTTVEVLFEESQKNGYITGLTPEYMRVGVNDTGLMHNVCAHVRITGIDEDTAIGELLSASDNETGPEPKTIHLPAVQG
jgi:threonylcarbamoyladenosine tRNA methylthiotransferase MtaB